MALRGKNKRTDRSKIDATPPWEDRVREELPPTTGPFDERDAPDDEIARIDLGALQVPVGNALDLRLDMNEAQQVIAVTLAAPDGSMQLGVFAAPRNEGIWDEVRAEIATSLREQKGAPKERTDGTFGVELTGTLAGDGGRVPVRFIGVDGPRWFLRAMLGPARRPIRLAPRATRICCAKSSWCGDRIPCRFASRCHFACRRTSCCPELGTPDGTASQ